jgi:hypothetical protein
MTIPSTSILIAAYNAAGTVARAVRSALAAFGVWEGTQSMQSIALTSLPETSLPLYIYCCYPPIAAWVCHGHRKGPTFNEELCKAAVTGVEHCVFFKSTKDSVGVMKWHVGS